MWSNLNDYCSVTLPQSLQLTHDIFKHEEYFLDHAKPCDSVTLLHLGKTYFDLGNHARALLFYLKASTFSNLEALRRVGCLYLFDRGVKRDDEIAVKCIRQAAEQGHALSQFSMGLLYEYGRVMPFNLQNALVWYHHSATQGCPFAINAIERLKLNGHMLEPSRTAVLYIEEQLFDLKSQFHLLNKRCSAHDDALKAMSIEIERLDNEILFLQLYSDEEDTDLDY